MKKLFSIFSLIILLGLAGCQNSNIFGWLHKEGNATSAESLAADAEAALADDNPAKAIEYTEKILAKEPNNSEALYIHAQAVLQQSGFDIGGILSSMIKSGTSGGSSAPNLRLMLSQALRRVPSEDDLLSSFESLDINAVAQAIGKAVEDLTRIVTTGDGRIPQNDVEVNLNLGILSVLDAAIKLIDWDGDYVIINDTDDIIKISNAGTTNEYGVQVMLTEGYVPVDENLTDEQIDELKALQDSLGNTLKDRINDMITELETVSIPAFDRALTKLGQNDIITNMKQGLADLKEALETDLYDKL